MTEHEKFSAGDRVRVAEGYWAGETGTVDHLPSGLPAVIDTGRGGKVKRESAVAVIFDRALFFQPTIISGKRLEKV